MLISINTMWIKNNQLWIDYAKIFAHGYMNYVFLINTLYKYINIFEPFFLDDIKIILIKKIHITYIMHWMQLF